MWAHPGKKLLFMGGEIAQEGEWNHDREIDWFLLADPAHAGVQRLVRDLNHIYRREPSLHALDGEHGGFQWLIGDDRSNSVFAFLRRGGADDHPLLVVCNMTPAPRHNYRIGVPRAGGWHEILNTDSRFYGGGDMGNQGSLAAEPRPAHGQPQSLNLTLPPLATLLLCPEG
jgi:1,4-alpha-glucan branching enzyme